jgi:putative membrane protein
LAAGARFTCFGSANEMRMRTGVSCASGTSGGAASWVAGALGAGSAAEGAACGSARAAGFVLGGAAPSRVSQAALQNSSTRTPNTNFQSVAWSDMGEVSAGSAPPSLARSDPKFAYDALPMSHLVPFLIHWAITAVSLWVASKIFKGLKFDGAGSLIISALLLGFANAVVRPLLVFFTLPLTLLTFGLFLLVINALMMLLVAWMVKGMRVSGFWTAFFASIFVSLLSIAIGAIVSTQDPGAEIQMPRDGAVWL